MKILSLFDGISVARVALERAGIPVDKYYASEVDKYALQIAQKNYPDTIQLGDVKTISRYTLERYGDTDIDLLIGGSPCQDLSIAKNDRKGLSGERSGLFWEYVRILKEAKPKYFILENVASMPKEARQTITETLGVEEVKIDAALVSAQQRKRLFWVGKLVNGQYKQIHIEQPEDRGIYLKDILESGESIKEKAYCLTAHQKDFVNDFLKRHQGNFVFVKDGKANAMTSVQTDNMVCVAVREATKKGYSIAEIGDSFDLAYPNSKTRRGRVKKGKTGSIMTSDNQFVVLKDEVRQLTSIEKERLQSLPDNYTEGVSTSQRSKCLGNAFNAEVVAYILKLLK